MNGIGHGGFALTTRNRLRTTQDVAHIRGDDNGWQLSLKSVIGTTTSTNNAFDSLSDEDVFAYCAGPAVVLSLVDESFNVSQRLFRARPHAPPINSAQSFYNPSTPSSTPTRSRHGSPLKDVGLSGAAEYSQDSPGGAKAGNWNREASCISLSRGARLLAVGETGYNPRVLIFSTAPDAPSDVPLSVLTDHSFGVQSISFSKDSRWLCSLGNSFDGFLLLYAVNPKTGAIRLHSSNKCSNVSSTAWMGNSVVTVGPRHVKVWRVEGAQSISPSKRPVGFESSSAAPPGSPGPKTFGGRNCLLGSLLDATFTCVMAVSDCKAVLCTSQGDICLLDDRDKSQRLERAAKVAYGIRCVYYDGARELVWIGGKDQRTEAFTLDSLTSPVSSPDISGNSPGPGSPSALNPSRRPQVLAIGSVRGRIILSDSERNVRLWDVEVGPDLCCLGADNRHFPAHDSAVLGVCELMYRSGVAGAKFLTYSAGGTVLFWLLDGTCTSRIDIRLDQLQCAEPVDANELKVLLASNLDESLLSGDKRGVLRITDRAGRSNVAIQAHNGDINGIAITQSENDVLVASCGRDRIVQLYRRVSEDLELLQTLDDHAAAVGNLLFSATGSSLLSMSSDRTVILRKLARVEGDAIAFLPIRVITLKASPVAFGMLPLEPDNIVVSTMDRQVQKYDTRTGRLVSSFRAEDPSSKDSVLVTSMDVQRISDGLDDRAILFGASSADRAIRMHDCDSGVLLSREQGQTAVSAVKVISRQEVGQSPVRLLISCGLDGTVSIWDIYRPKQDEDSPTRADSPLRQTPASSHPARKTLSRSEISKFQRSLESEEDGISPIRSPSPSRIRRKTSRYSMADTRRSSLAPLSTPSNTPIPTERKSSGDSSQTTTKPNNTLRTRRPSLDHRRRSKSYQNLNDLNDSAEQICKSLRAFRERVESSVADKLKPKTLQDLENELDLALIALSEKTNRVPTNTERVAGESLDVYMAKMIDERLALRASTQVPASGAPSPVGMERRESAGLETLVET